MPERIDSKSAKTIFSFAANDPINTKGKVTLNNRIFISPYISAQLPPIQVQAPHPQYHPLLDFV
ncbi:hypothetical protein [Rubritalea tangerina]|uniref:hypothetical protein n=1 Tax=Rubritalea tangerina TaxID=430798 RepID=UPI00361E1082